MEITKNKIDKSNMNSVIIESTKQLQKGLGLAKDIKIDGDIKNIVICGVGGSALPADILNTVAKPLVPIYIQRNYTLPFTANEHSLVICVSYSGNTEETLSVLKEAIDRKFRVIGISTGGQVEKLCTLNNIPLVKIPSGIQPRCATGYIFSALAQLLINKGIIEDISKQIIETSNQLAAINPLLQKEGKKLSKKIVGKIPVIYSSDNFKAVAMIWKIKFNENSKIPAFYNSFPELNHNEMVGHTGLKKLGVKNFQILILQNLQDHERMLKRIKLTADIIKKTGAKVEIVNMKEGSLLFKIFSTLLLGDWVSYYLALENNIDPTPVKIVEEFKSLMQD